MAKRDRQLRVTVLAQLEGGGSENNESELF